MEQLASYSFASGKVPVDWRIEETHHTFERGALRSGRVIRPLVPVPGNGWQCLRVEIDIEPIVGAAIECGDNTFGLTVDLQRHLHRLTAFTCTLAESQTPIPKKSGPYRVGFELGARGWRADVDGIEVVSGIDPASMPVAGMLQLGFWDDCLVHRITLLGEGPVPVSLPVSRKSQPHNFFLEVCVDFPDDLMHAPFDARMMDELFAELKRWGTRRCHWIYYGKMSEGWWDHSEFGAGKNAFQTVANIGEIFPAAVQAAHAHGIELYGLIKPFDMGFWNSFGEGTAAAKEHGRLPRIGGPIGWVAHFVAQHPEWLMERKPGVFGDAANELFSRIDLVAESAAPVRFTVNEVRLYVSDDNASYREYAGPIEREEVIEDYPVWAHTASGGRATGELRRARVMRFKNLAIRNKYIALAVDGRAGSFGNTLINLVHVFGPNGEERRLTYGLKPREGEVTPEGTWSKEMLDNHHPDSDFRDRGLEFDRWDGMPTACMPGLEGIDQRHWLDSGHGFLAIARGKDRATIATLSPVYPEVRAWWLSWVRACLEAGADGIELRFSHHHSPFAWAEFGFEKPVRDEFLKRHGVDLWQTDDFDVAAWRRLRGETYTQFHREARALTNQHGKPLSLHIEQLMCVEPELAAGMDMHLDWRTWLEEGLADSVTAKNVVPGTRFAREILALARARGIEVVSCPFSNSIWRAPGGEKIIEDRIRSAREAGFDGFQFFECAAVVRATPQGKIFMERPALVEVFRQNFIQRTLG